MTRSTTTAPNGTVYLTEIVLTGTRAHFAIYTVPANGTEPRLVDAGNRDDRAACMVAAATALADEIFP